MGFIRRVDLNPRRAKVNLTVKLLMIFSPMITAALILFHPVGQLSHRSIWLYPLVFIVHWLYVLCGPTIAGFYLQKKFGLAIVGPPAGIAAVALILWLSIFFKKKIDPTTVFIPVLMWLIAGGWTTWLMMAAGK